MPFRYSIRFKTKTEKTDKYGYSDTVENISFMFVRKDQAELHESGHKQFVTKDGVPLTQWIWMPNNCTPVDLTRIKKSSRYDPLPDMFGQPLQVGDLVAMHIRKRDELQIGEVIGFVKQGKVRVMPLENTYQHTGLLFFPNQIVLVPKDALGDDPQGEWDTPAEMLGTSDTDT